MSELFKIKKYDFETWFTFKFEQKEYTVNDLLKVSDEKFEEFRKIYNEGMTWTLSRGDPRDRAYLFVFENIALQRRIQKLERIINV